MTERAAILERTQLGVEVSPGTAVAATRRMRSFGLKPKLQADGAATIRNPGHKYPGGRQAHGREWVESAIEGHPSYTEMAYLLDSLISPSTPSTPMGATNARERTWTADSDAEHAPQTYTFEHGQAVRAGEFSNAAVNSLDLGFPAKRPATLGGSVVGAAWVDDQALTALTDPTDDMPIHGRDFTVYIDTTSGGLGSTPLTRDFNSSIAWAAQRSLVWSGQAAVPSFVGRVEVDAGAPVISLDIQSDAAAWAMLQDWRDSVTKFVRIQGIGPLIEVGQNYEFRFDAAVHIEADGFSVNEDMEGVTIVKLTLRCENDLAWGKSYEVFLRNGLAAL